MSGCQGVSGVRVTGCHVDGQRDVNVDTLTVNVDTLTGFLPGRIAELFYPGGSRHVVRDGFLPGRISEIRADLKDRCPAEIYGHRTFWVRGIYRQKNFLGPAEI